MNRRTALGILGTFPVIGPATAKLAEEPVYEVACVSKSNTIATIGRRWDLLGTAHCIGEKDALEFINGHYEKWLRELINAMATRRSTLPPDKLFKARFEKFTSLDQDLSDWWGFHAAVKKL